VIHEVANLKKAFILEEKGEQIIKVREWKRVWTTRWPSQPQESFHIGEEGGGDH